MAIRIPDGYVFVKKTPGVAAELLAAAAEIGADSVIGVRSVTGGYHVTQEIAEQYQSSFETVDEEVEEAAAETTDEEVVDDVAPEEVVEDEAAREEVETPPLPDESWTVAQVDEWASQQTPPVIFPAGVTKKVDKLAFISPSAE